MTDEQFDREYAELLARFDRRIWWEVRRKVRCCPALESYAEDMHQFILLRLWERRRFYKSRPEWQSDLAYIAFQSRQSANDFQTREQPHQLVRFPKEPLPGDEPIQTESYPDGFDTACTKHRQAAELSDRVKEKVGRLLEFVRESDRQLLLELVDADNLKAVGERLAPQYASGWAKVRKSVLLNQIKKGLATQGEEVCHRTSLSKNPR